MQNRVNKEAQLALESLLAGLNHDQLQSLLLKLVEQEPSLIATIEKQVAAVRALSEAAAPSPAAPAKPSIAVDTKAIRRQVRSSIHSLDRMRSSEAYWHVGAVVGEIGQLVEQAMQRRPRRNNCSRPFRLEPMIEWSGLPPVIM